MADLVAWWGAVAGSAAAGFTIRREIAAQRIRVRVNHGWRYVPDPEDPSRFHDLIVYILVTNTGGRPVPIQYVAWEWFADVGERTADGRQVLRPSRAEVSLKEPVLLEPDGIPFKVEVMAGQVAHLFDPMTAEARPVAFTGGGYDRWEGRWGPLTPRIPEQYDLAQMAERFEELKREAPPPIQLSREEPDLYSIDPAWTDGSQ